MKEVIDRNPRNNHGQTPLHLAAKNGHLKVCKTIIKEADDKNPKDNQGMTPFHIAALMGHEKICKVFMSSVDDYNPKTVDGRTPISCAAQNDHSDVVITIANVFKVRQYIEESETDDVTILEKAAREKHFNDCKSIVEGPDNKNGMTTFHLAALAGEEKLCKVFIEDFDNLNPKTKDGQTPIGYAAQNDHSKVVIMIADALNVKRFQEIKLYPFP